MLGSPSPMEESHATHHRKSAKQSKILNRSSKRSSPVHEHGAVVVDGRHKRVWKACERCRMKKTKCDGESPCKRCKDDGLVCTAGSRKKTEFKQLPRGYAEVLENTQYALIATVQKLYTMVRNNESWDLGEPEMNDRNQPVIHDIASRLGCIRPSPDLPYAFPEGADDFAELQNQLETNPIGKSSHDSPYSSPSMDRAERASSSESDHSDLSKEYNQMLWSQQQGKMIAPKAPPPAINTRIAQPSLQESGQRTSSMEDGSTYSSRTSLDTSVSSRSSIYSDFKSETSVIRNDSPFSPWSAGNDFLDPAQVDLSSLYQQQYSAMPMSSLLPRQIGTDTDVLKAMQLADGFNFAEGTIRPNMLDCRNTYDMDPMDSMMYTGDYESAMGMA